MRKDILYFDTREKCDRWCQALDYILDQSIAQSIVRSVKSDGDKMQMSVANG